MFEVMALVYVAGLFASPVLVWHHRAADRVRQMATWWGIVMGASIVGLAVAATNAAHQHGGGALLVTWVVAIGLIAVVAATVGATVAAAAAWRRIGSGRRGSRAAVR